MVEVDKVKEEGDVMADDVDVDDDDDTGGYLYCTSITW